MSGFSGINQFGNLTLTNGQRLTFKDFDKDGDGKISETEYKEVLKENNIDTIELSTVDKNGDKEITQDEFQLLEQKQQMQEAVNALASDIAIDFAGNKSKYIPELTNALKEYIEEYANEYKGSISDMSTYFEKALPGKYEALKNEILAKDPETITSTVINSLIEANSNMPADALKTLASQLDSAAQSFTKTYTGANLETDLKAYLEEWLNKTDSEKLADDVSKYSSRVGKFGATIETGELASLKECAKQLMTSALDKGISVKLTAQTVTKSNLNAVLNKYTDGETLKSDVQAFINSLSNVNKKDQIITDAAKKAQEAEDKKFTDIKGSEYQVNTDLIDISKIASANHIRTKDAILSAASGNMEDAKARALSAGREKAALILNSESCKNQFREQIKSMLEAKGIDFSRVEDIFENAYRQSLWKAIDMEGSLQTQNFSWGLWGNRLGTSMVSMNLQTLISNFGKVFNETIASAITETNKSNTDMDITDIDYAATAGNNKAVKTNIEVGRGTYFGSNSNAKTQLGNYINTLKSEMYAKAKSMCLANGIKFDSKSFNTIFNNAKVNAVNDAVPENGWINLRVGMENFANKFKTSYTSWVDTEKAKNTNQ